MSTEQQSQLSDDQVHAALDTRLLFRLWSYLLPYRSAVLGCVLLSFVVAGLRLSQPIVLHRMIDEADGLLRAGMQNSAAGIGSIARIGLLFLGLIFLAFLFDVVFNFTTGVIGQKSMHDLRLAIFKHVNRLDTAFFDKTPVGRLITRMTSDVSALNDLFSSGVIAILADSLLLGGLLVLMAVYSVRLTLVVLCATPFMFLTVLFFRRYSRRWYLEARARLAGLNAYLQENVAGMQTAQSNNREDRNMERFRTINDSYKEAQIRTILAFALFFPVLNVTLYFTLTGVIWLGGREVIQGQALGGEPLSFATLFLFVQCINMLFTPLRNLSERYNILQSAMASSARIFRLLDTPSYILKPEGNEAADGPPKLDGAIVFEHVGFEYVEGEPVLHDINFEIRRGSTVAIVGATGSGKTTLVNLLTRLYDVTEGRILLDGTDLRRFDPHDWRRLFAVVLQEVFLFFDTIAGNIRFTNPDLTDEEIWELLREVHAEDFVRSLPGGIDAQVHERGSTFSTGQKQLLAFARALAADPQVLILDEATANVDTATEQRIQEAIARLLEGRTAVVIAHRLSTIRRADLILVMHKGRLRESGTHEELLALNGLYRRLYELQFESEAIAEQVS